MINIKMRYLVIIGGTLACHMYAMEHEKSLYSTSSEILLEKVFLAIEHHDEKALCELIARIPLDVLYNGETLLHTAIRKYFGAGIWYIVYAADMQGVSLENIPRMNGHTPLHDAALRGYVAVVHLLLARGADPFALDAWGETPYQKACYYYELFEQDHFKASAYLLKAVMDGAIP